MYSRLLVSNVSSFFLVFGEGAGLARGPPPGGRESASQTSPPPKSPGISLPNSALAWFSEGKIPTSAKTAGFGGGASGVLLPPLAILEKWVYGGAKKSKTPILKKCFFKRPLASGAGKPAAKPPRQPQCGAPNCSSKFAASSTPLGKT